MGLDFQLLFACVARARRSSKHRQIMKTVGFCGSQGIRAFFADTAKDNKLREAACRKYVENRHANCSTRGKDNESQNHRFGSQRGPKIDPGGLFLASGGLLRAKLAPGGSQDRSGRPPKAKNKTFGAPKRRPRGAKSARKQFLSKFHAR